MTATEEITLHEARIVELRDQLALDWLLERPVDERAQAEIQHRYDRLAALNHREAA